MATVLIIDSEAPVAQSLSDALALRGVASHVTADGTDGLEYAKNGRPDVIVLCVELTRGSGYSVCNKLKKDPALASIPLVLTSSQATEETFEQHKKLRTRAEAYLKKPYDTEALMGVIGQYVALGGATVAPPAPAGASDVEVSLDDMDVEAAPSGRAAPPAPADDDEYLDVSFEGEEEAAAAPSPDETLESLIDEPHIAPPAPVARAAAPAPTRPAAAAPAPATRKVEAPAAAAPAAPMEARRSTASTVTDAETERLRSEVRTLRQRVQKLEQDLQDKEVEFNDRLLAESSRVRDALEVKKKLALVEREIAKYQQMSGRAQAEADQANGQLKEVQAQLEAAESERATLSEKIGQLVDKVKELAAERDALKQQVEQMEQNRQAVQGDAEAADRVREKAKKAVDIAMQLLDETGLAHGVRPTA